MPCWLLLLSLFLAQALSALPADWLRAGINTNQLVWGIRGRLLWALPPAGFRPDEPRGLIRLGYPVLPDGGYDLINFIAIEPVVRGRRGFSELEKSKLDMAPGKRIWAEELNGPTMGTNLIPGTVRMAREVEELDVPLRVEPFDNGAHVRLLMHQRSDRPDEIRISVFQEADSAPLQFCILTATMGNMARTRQLWLKDRVLSSHQLYSDYTGTGFAPHRVFSLAKLYRTAERDVLVAITSDENDLASVQPFPGSSLWQYRGHKVTQYWRIPATSLGDDAQAVVNARFTYWGSERRIPGGVAFENFEVRESFHDGQDFAFGITRETPQALGFKVKQAWERPAD